MPDVVATDALSDFFDQVQVRNMMTGGFAVRGPWASRVAVSRPLKLVALVAGSAHVSVDGPGGPVGPVEMVPGDVVLLNHRTHLEVRGGRGAGPPAELIPEASFDSMALAAADLSTDDVLVGGWIQVDPAGRALLSAALPGLVHVHTATPAATRLAVLVAQLFTEASSGRLGSAFAIRQNGQLILLEVLRAYLEQERPPIGWLRLLADEPLAPAVQLMHENPATAWGLAELARAANMSRSSFAERFRNVAGVPALAYLSRWRMVLAQRALRDPTCESGTSPPNSGTDRRARSARRSSARSASRPCTTGDVCAPLRDQPGDPRFRPSRRPPPAASHWGWSIETAARGPRSAPPGAPARVHQARVPRDQRSSRTVRRRPARRRGRPTTLRQIRTPHALPRR